MNQKNEKDFIEKVFSIVNKVDPHANGSLFVRKLGDVFEVYGTITTTLSKDAFLEKSLHYGDIVMDGIVFEEPTVMVVANVEPKQHMSVSSEDKRFHYNDEVGVVYQGWFPIDKIVVADEDNDYKIDNKETNKKINDCVLVVGFIAPIVLDRNLNVIDGVKRLSIAKNRRWSTVPVIIIDSSGDVSDFLRLAINRSSEFQRWDFVKIDEFLEKVPQTQPLLEPLGFYGKKYLPETYFADNIVGYVIDKDIDQMSMYRQDEGLAKWAEKRREQIKNQKEIERKLTEEIEKQRLMDKEYKRKEFEKPSQPLGGSVDGKEKPNKGE